MHKTRILLARRMGTEVEDGKVQHPPSQFEPNPVPFFSFSANCGYEYLSWKAIQILNEIICAWKPRQWAREVIYWHYYCIEAKIVSTGVELLGWTHMEGDPAPPLACREVPGAEERVQGKRTSICKGLEWKKHECGVEEMKVQSDGRGVSAISERQRMARPSEP